MLFNAANEYVLAFLSAQVESGAVNSSILDTWKTQEDGFKTLLDNNEKKKEKKDKNAPKGAKSAYILFCADERPKVKEDEPGMDAKKIAAELGKRWKELKDDDKEKVKEYQRMADDDKIRFKTEMENYVPGEMEEVKEKTKKTKDKNAPKGAKSAYILFCADERAQVKEDIPDIAAKDVLVELGKRWKALKDEDKVKYQEMADEDKVRFKTEMENYVPGEVVEDDKKIKKTKDKNAPKGARSAYILFCADERAQVKEDIPDIAAKDVLVELGKRWKVLKDEDEDRYNEYQKMADEDKVRFKTEMENYVPGEVVEEEKEKTKKKKDKNAPKGARSAYILFCADERAQVKEDIPDISAKDVLVELGKRWKALKDDDEDRYNEYQVMAEKDKVRFKKEMENYVPEDTEDKPKKEKTKDSPKRSKTAYQLFCEEQKEAVKQDGFEGKDVIAELAKRWKELESDDEDYFKELKSRADKLKKEFQEANPVEEKEKKIKKVEKDEKKDENKVEKDTKKDEKSVDKVKNTKGKTMKKKTNKDIVYEIMESFDDDETVTMRMIKKKLDEIEVVIDKTELKEIVNAYNEE
jgi:high mobility group protein B1